MKSNKAVKAAIAEYKRLLAYQRTLGESEQWTMGEAIRSAKLRVYAEAEAAEVHGRAL